jgi:hypothetical protein
LVSRSMLALQASKLYALCGCMCGIRTCTVMSAPKPSVTHAQLSPFFLKCCCCVHVCPCYTQCQRAHRLGLHLLTGIATAYCTRSDTNQNSTTIATTRNRHRYHTSLPPLPTTRNRHRYHTSLPPLPTHVCPPSLSQTVYERAEAARASVRRMREQVSPIRTSVVVAVAHAHVTARRACHPHSLHHHHAHQPCPAAHQWWLSAAYTTSAGR